MSQEKEKKKKKKPGTAADLTNKIREKERALTTAIKKREQQVRKENH